MKEVKLSLNVNEINLILKSLGNLPFNQVNELVARIHMQAQEQLRTSMTPESEKASDKDLTHK